jgi:hypothetical protein
MTEHNQRRLGRHRLAILGHAEEACGNVSATCRYCGISRQCFYKRPNRFDELGDEGLGGFGIARLGRIDHQTKPIQRWLAGDTPYEELPKKTTAPM